MTAPTIDKTVGRYIVTATDLATPDGSGRPTFSLATGGGTLKASTAYPMKDACYELRKLSANSSAWVDLIMPVTGGSATRSEHISYGFVANE